MLIEKKVMIVKSCCIMHVNLKDVVYIEAEIASART